MQNIAKNVDFRELTQLVTGSAYVLRSADKRKRSALKISHLLRKAWYLRYSRQEERPGRALRGRARPGSPAFSVLKLQQNADNVREKPLKSVNYRLNAKYLLSTILAPEKLFLGNVIAAKSRENSRKVSQKSRKSTEHRKKGDFGYKPLSAPARAQLLQEVSA